MRLEILGDSSDASLDDIFEIRLADAKMFYLNAVYPFNHTITEMPDDERALIWQVRCAIELYNLNKDGLSNAIMYSENGLQIQFSKAGLSRDLIAQLPPPRAGVPICKCLNENTEETTDEEDGN